MGLTKSRKLYQWSGLRKLENLMSERYVIIFKKKLYQWMKLSKLNFYQWIEHSQSKNLISE